MTEIQQKIKNLPTWAREHIRQLELRAAPQTEELARLRGKIEAIETIKRKQQDRIDAMVEMFQCAAKGGNAIAAAVKSIVETYTVDEGA